MEPVTRNDCKKLADDPLSFATMMEDHELETVIVTFVCTLLNKKTKPR